MRSNETPFSQNFTTIKNQDRNKIKINKIIKRYTETYLQLQDTNKTLSSKPKYCVIIYWQIFRHNLLNTEST